MFSNKTQSAGMTEVSHGHGVYSGLHLEKEVGLHLENKCRKYFVHVKLGVARGERGVGANAPLKCNPAIMLVLIPSDQQNWAPCSFCRYREQPTPLSNQ